MDNRKLQRAIERFDLELYVNQTFDLVKEASGDELRVDCFSPNGCADSDTKQHLWINAEKKVWICYKCGYGDHKQQPGTGWLPRFIADAEAISVRAVIERLTGEVHPTSDEALGDMLADLFDEQEKPRKEKEIKEMRLPGSFRPCTDSAYAKSRGISSSMLEKHDARFCAQSQLTARWNRRLIFPVYDREGELRSAVGRSVENKNPRWVVWPKSDIQGLLWPLGYWQQGQWVPNGNGHIVLVEGVIDALAVEEVTGHCALATFGKKLSARQVALLQELQPREVTLAWDYEAQPKMAQVVKRLAGRFERVSVFPFHHDVWKTKDFGDMLLAPKRLGNVFVDEMVDRIQFESSAYVAWAAKASGF
jgi:hypothetical protein